MEHPGIVVVVNPLEVNSNGYRSEQTVYSAHSEETPIVLSIDIVPIDSVLQLAEKSPDQTFVKIMSPYVQRIFTGGSEVLWPPSLKKDGPIEFGEDVPNFARLKHLVNQRLSDQNIREKLT